MHGRRPKAFFGLGFIIVGSYCVVAFSYWLGL